MCPLGAVNATCFGANGPFQLWRVLPRGDRISDPWRQASVRRFFFIDHGMGVVIARPLKCGERDVNLVSRRPRSRSQLGQGQASPHAGKDGRRGGRRGLRWLGPLTVGAGARLGSQLLGLP